MVDSKKIRKQLYMLAFDYKIPLDNVYFDNQKGSFYIDIPNDIPSHQVEEIKIKLAFLAYEDEEE